MDILKDDDDNEEYDEDLEEYDEEEEKYSKDNLLDEDEEELEDIIKIEDNIIGEEILNEEEDLDSDEEEIDFNEDKEVLRKKKITIPILTKYERTKILCLRSQQIMENSPVLININDMKLPLTPYNIAREELKQKRIPFKVKRNLPDNTYEIWKITEFKKIFT